MKTQNSSNPARRRLPPRGFTLVEMMLVFLLIGIMISIAIPRWRDVYSETSVHESSKMIIALADFAREKSVIEHRQYRLVLDKRERAYWLERQTTFPQTGTEAFEPSKDNLSARFRLPDQFYFDEIRLNGKKARGNSSITFYPDGTSDELQLTVANGGGDKWHLIIPNRFGKTISNAQ
jgi:prepilin-type N-terminal cleavage/methylation domain-containing protein